MDPYFQLLSETYHDFVPPEPLPSEETTSSHTPCSQLNEHPDDIVTPNSCDGDFWDWDGAVMYNMSFDAERPLALDAVTQFKYANRRIHRYSRILRFRTTLAKLLGASGRIPDGERSRRKPNIYAPRVLSTVWSDTGPAIFDYNTAWNAVRTSLKKHGWRKYYDSIPLIIARLGGASWPPEAEKRFSAIMQDFLQFNFAFNSRLRNVWNRRYFPSIRYIALRLLKLHRIRFPYRIPLARTLRKSRSLNELFNDLTDPAVAPIYIEPCTI